MEIWAGNSINGQKLHTAQGTGLSNQEITTTFCWAANDYAFTLSSTYGCLMFFTDRDSKGWDEASWFYLYVNGIDYLRGDLYGTPYREMKLSRSFSFSPP